MCLERSSLRSPTKAEIAKVKEGFKVFRKKTTYTQATIPIPFFSLKHVFMYAHPTENGTIKTTYKSVYGTIKTTYKSVWSHTIDDDTFFEYKRYFWNKTSEPGFHVFLTAEDAQTYLLAECRTNFDDEMVVCKVKVRGLMMFGIERTLRFSLKIDKDLTCFTCAQLKIIEEIK